MRIVDIRERPVRISRYRDPHIPSGDLTPASCPLSPTWPEPDGRWSSTASPRSGALSEEIRHFADLGFTHMKIKIGGAPLDHDLRRIEAAAAHLAGSVWADLGEGTPDGICADAQNAVWYADVPGKRCVRVAEGGTVLQTVELDRGGFACALGGPGKTTLFIVACWLPGRERSR